MILVAVLLGSLLFVTAIGTLVGTQVADLAQNSERYVNRTVDFLNDNFNTNIDAADVNNEINDPDGVVQRFIKSQQDEALQLSFRVLSVLLQVFGLLFFTFYLVADGPRLRRAICSRFAPDRQRQILDTWDLAIQKTGGYLYSRLLLALLSAFAHWVLLQSVGAPAAVALALWVGLVSQFIPVVGTYIAGALPILLVFIDSPVKALIVVIFIIVYQQVENYLFAPRITARTMEIHPAVAFGAALGGAALLGGIGAILALPTAAMFQALVSSWGQRHAVLDDPLTSVQVKRARRDRRRAEAAAGFSPGDTEEDADGG
jgi:predicted PurR-regulated permease PerM